MPSYGHLGRRVPTDGIHVDKYPYRLFVAPEPFVVNRIMSLPGWHKRHDQSSEGSCFKAGTLITMADGSIKPIEEIRTLDRVATAEGNSGRVLQTMVRDYNGDIIKLGLGGHNHLEMTLEHPILTKRGYIEAKDIQLDDGVALPRYDRARSRSIDTAEFVDVSQLRRVKTGIMEMSGGIQDPGNKIKAYVSVLPETIPLTPKFGRLIGLYLAEGSCDTTKIRWTYNSKENDLINETVELIATELGAIARIQVRPNNSTNVVLYGKHGVLLFKELCKTGSINKKLHGKLHRGNNEFLGAVLEGGLDGDGHYRRNGGQGITISHYLALDMFNIANLIGRRATINCSEPHLNNGAKTRQSRWDILIPDGQQNTYRSQIDDDYVWRKVKGINVKNYVGLVFNLHVEGDNSYIAEGIGVHNCVGHGIAMERAIANTRQNILANIPLPRTRRYNPIHIWNEAKKIDEWADTNPGDSNGTSVRAGYDVARTQGMQRVTSISIVNGIVIPKVGSYKPDPKEGIAANRGAVNVDEMRFSLKNAASIAIGVNWYSNFDAPQQDSFGNWWIGQGNLGAIRGGHCLTVFGASDSKQAFKLKNSWGSSYPQVWLPYQTMERLLNEYGEAAIVTDK